MIRKLLSLLALLALPGLGHAAGMIDLARQPTISAQLARTFCDGKYPYAVVNLFVNASDRGRPGLVYVAMHDPQETKAYYLANQQAVWLEYQGEAQFVPYAIMADGLRDIAIVVPAQVATWRLWVGYGTLTVAGESEVQRVQEGIQKARALGKNVQGIDPNHHRRTVIQQDMSDNGKYINVLTWGPENIPVCYDPSWQS